MSFWHAYTACAGGVLLSFIIPVLSISVKKQFNVGGPAGFGGIGLLARTIWQQAKPYATLAVLSLAVAIVIIAFSGDSLKTWQLAFLAGYAWDSTLQKIAGKP